MSVLNLSSLGTNLIVEYFRELKQELMLLPRQRRGIAARLVHYKWIRHRDNRSVSETALIKYRPDSHEHAKNSFADFVDMLKNRVSVLIACPRPDASLADRTEPCVISPDADDYCSNRARISGFI
jgi:hypothetical protein